MTYDRSDQVAVSSEQHPDIGRRVATVILHYGRVPDTLTAVRSILNGSLPSTVVVVDNAGDAEELKDNLTDVPEAAVEVTPAPTNLGFAVGVNLGIERAQKQTVDYIFLLNNDAFVERRTLEELIDAAEAEPDAGILSPVVYFAADRSRVWSAGMVRARITGFFRNVPPPWLAAKTSGILAVDAVAGCAMLLTSRLVETIGAFDDRLFMYYEDVDYCTRARAAGFRVLTVTGARAYHKVDPVVGDGRGDLARLSRRARGKATYYTLHGCQRGAQAALLRLGIGVVAFGVRCLFARDGRAFRVYLAATCAGRRDARRA